MNYKHFTKFIFLSLSIIIISLLVNIGTVKAQELPNISKEDATQIAQKFVQNHANSKDAWQNVVIEEPIIMYDLTGVPSAYLFHLYRDSADAGYITISSYPIPNPVLEFSTNQSRLKIGEDEFNKVIEDTQVVFDFQKPLYLGLLGYYYRGIGPGGPVVIDIASRELSSINEETLKYFAENSQTKTAKASLTEIQTNITPQSLSKILIYGPDYRWYRGCGPTAVGNAMGYYSDRGYPNLVSGGSGGNYRPAIDEIADLMGTTSEGWTWLPIDDDMRNYTALHGYLFTSNQYFNPPFQTLINEVNARHPVIVLVNDHIKYGNHFITAFGYEYDPSNTNYQYMIVHDTWGNGDYNVQFGSGYSKIWFLTLSPTSGSIIVDTTSPTSTMNLLPEYVFPTTFELSWSGNDDPGGLGIETYDVQVKDGEFGSWSDLLTKTTKTSTSMSGVPGHTYFYRSRASDKDRNVEQYPSVNEGDTHVTVVPYTLQGKVYGNTGKPVIGAVVDVKPKGTLPTKTDRYGQFKVGIPDDDIYKISVVGNVEYQSLPSMQNLRYSQFPEINFYLPPSNNLVQNGNFEVDTAGDWVFLGDVPPSRSSLIAHTGDISLRLGGEAPIDNSLSSTSQTLSIPEGVTNTTLSFMYFVPSGNPAGTFEISLSDGVNTIVENIIPNSFDSWNHIWLEIKSFQGKTLTIAVKLIIPSRGQSAVLYLDEMSLGSEVGGVFDLYLPVVNK